MYTEFKKKYDIMLEKLLIDLDTGLLNKDEEVQIIRTNNKDTGYNPIAYWYYSHERMLKIFIIDKLDEPNDILYKRKLAKKYEEDLNSLTTMKVSDLIFELKNNT